MSSTMRYLSYLVTLLVAVFITACGGGGGSAGSTPGSSTLSLFTTAPSTLTLAKGTAQDYSIGGGRAPYTATSNNTAIVAAGVNGNVLTIGAVNPGTAEVQIRDALGIGITVTVNVNTGTTRALFTTAPAAITVTPGSSGSQTYLVGGGSTPYTATSSNASVAAVSLVNGNLTITGLTGGTATIQVMDTLGATLSVTVTVPTAPAVPLFTTAPSPITVAIGTSPGYSVGGGTAPYTVTTSNASVATASVVGNVLTVNALAAGSANIQVRDASNAIVNVSVTVPSASTVPLFTTAPSPVTVAIGASPVYTVGGGAAPYTASSSNVGVATVTMVGTVLTVRGAATGNATIVVRDAAGASLNVSVTVPAPNTVPFFTTAPPTVTIAIAAAPGFIVGGGTGPYTATSSNTSIATTTLVGTALTIRGNAAGAATIVLRDAAGAILNVAVTVPAASTVALFTTAPPAVTVALTSSPTYTVGGGSGVGYIASSSNPSVATASILGNTLTITGVGVGSASVVVRDSSNATLTIAVTVPTSTGLALFTTAPSAITTAIGAPNTYLVGGGIGPYTATSSNTGVATVTAAPSPNMTITGVSAGSSIVVIRDSVGTTLSVSVTVSPPNTVALFTTAPASITVPLGTAPIYVVGGGTGPYTATSSNASVASATPAPSPNLVISGLAVGTANVLVRDAAGVTVNIAVNVTAASTLPLFTTAPPSITLAIGTPAVYQIGGGSPGYTATSSNTGVVTVAVTATTTLTVTAVAPGSASIVVRDVNGATVNIAVTVSPTGTIALFTTAPPAVIVTPGSNTVYAIGGGTQAYTATSSNTSVANVTVTGTSTLTIQGVAAGTASVTVRDSVGSTPVVIGVTVAQPAMTVNPVTATALIGDVLQVTITGGTGPYTAVVSNTLVANASITGNIMTVNVLQAGTNIGITVFDANGASAVFSLTSSVGGTAIQLSPSALSISEHYNDPITLFVYGATGAVTAFSSDPTILQVVSVSGNASGTVLLTIDTGTAKVDNCVLATTPITFTVVDSTGAIANSTITILNSVTACP